MRVRCQLRPMRELQFFFLCETKGYRDFVLELRETMRGRRKRVGKQIYEYFASNS